MNVQWIGHNGRGRGSRLIKWATRGKYSHISIRVIDMPQWLIDWAHSNYGYVLTRDHDFESLQFKGVIHHPFIPSENQGWYDVIGFVWDEQKVSKVVKEACKLVGSKYDWRGVGGFITRRDVQNSLKWFCSEFGSHLLRKASIIIMNMPDHWITPNTGSASPILRCVKEAIT